MKNYLFLLFALISNCAYADFTFENTLTVGNPVTGNQLYLEPRISKATYQATDIKQNGYLYGIKGSYDLFVINAPYLGFEGSYMRGKIKGSDLESTYRDFLFEGKLGFTMGIPSAYSFSPYGGIGYEEEKNNYITTPIEQLKYYYFSLGLVSNFYLSPNISAGLNCKIKFPFSGDHDVKNDSIDTRVSISKKIQYLIEVPFTYWASNAMSISAVPFYENKKYNNTSVSTIWNSTAKMHQWGLGIRANFAF
jgi:hypothetical protein